MDRKKRRAEREVKILTLYLKGGYSQARIRSEVRCARGAVTRAIRDYHKIEWEFERLVGNVERRLRDEEKYREQQAKIDNTKFAPRNFDELNSVRVDCGFAPVKRDGSIDYEAAWLMAGRRL